MHSEFIPYDNLNPFNLFLKDYCKKGIVSEFYNRHFSEIVSGHATLKPKFGKITHRKELCEILYKTNSKHEISDKTTQNIQSLRSENTYAVVTGQQMGIYSGPLYTVYKTIGVIKTAEYLKAKYSDCDFVPVFWLEHEDSDFREINNIQIISKNNENLSYFYDKSNKNELNDPIYYQFLKEDIDQINESMFNDLSPTDFSQLLSEKVRKYYKSGNGLSDAFAGWLNLLFGKYGLVLINPSESGLKKIVSHIFYKSIENADEIHEYVLNQSKKLSENGFFIQVETKPTYLYCLDVNEIKSEQNINKINKFRIKTPLSNSQKAAFLEKINKNPEQFIPNVLLRPIVQDYILPTAAYIAGPGEIAYFAQTAPLYQYFNITQPFIIPRPSVTIVEKKISNLLEKYELKVSDIINYHETLKNSLMSKYTGDRLFELLQKQWLKISEEMNDLREPLNAIDVTLSGLLDTTIKKMNDNFSVLQRKVVDSEKRKNGELLGHADKLISHIYPDNDFQERKINILYYLNKYDFSFIDLLYDNLSIHAAQHQVLYL